MKLLRTIALLCILSCCFLQARAQYFDLQGNRKRVTIPFRLIRNMVIIQLNINGIGPFNFVLDTGVGMMIITEPKLIDSIKILSKRLIKIPGLGNGEDEEAYITSALNVDIHNLTSVDVSAAILQKDQFNLSNYAGIPIDGLLGYEFFNSLAVKINFGDSTITVCRPKNLRARGTKVPITIQERKPYIQSMVTYPNGKKVDSKLVIDIGAGHPVSLENMIGNDLPQKYITANLGVGLNGPIQGFIGRVKEVDLGKYKIQNVIASFPDLSKRRVIPAVPRDGNLGIGILKKFDVTFDYQDNAMYLKPGLHYDDPYEHDMSGLEYYATGANYQHIVISRVEPGSAGDAIGLEKGDEIMGINFKNVDKMSLEEIDGIFKSKDGRSLILEVFHDNRYDNVILTLKRRI
jgi:hypothetical protein